MGLESLHLMGAFDTYFLLIACFLLLYCVGFCIYGNVCFVWIKKKFDRIK